MENENEPHCSENKSTKTESTEQIRLFQLTPSLKETLRGAASQKSLNLHTRTHTHTHTHTRKHDFDE